MDDNARDRGEGLLQGERWAFFKANGVVLVLWAREKLAGDSGIENDGARWGGIALAHDVGSRQEVDDVIAHARASGGTVTREPPKRFTAAMPVSSATWTATPGRSRTSPRFGLAADGSVLLLSE